MKTLIVETRPPTIGAAAIASLGIYCLFPVLRGAVWGLFPGIANRSFVLGAKGVACGAIFDLIYQVLWIEMISTRVLKMYWEPRAEFNEFLACWLPGRDEVVTHMGSVWPNAIQFWSGVLVWLLWMVLCWWLVWTPRLSMFRLLCALVVAAASVSVACGVLWIISPMDHWPDNPRYPFGVGLDGPLWDIVFFSVFPICGMLVAGWFGGSQNQSLDQTADRIQRSGESMVRR